MNDDVLFHRNDKSYEDLLNALHSPKIPRIPQSILDGSMTLREFAEWSAKTEQIQARDDLIIRDWLTPYVRKSLERLSRKVNGEITG